MQIDYKEVGKRIRKYRERLNLTQEDLAFAIKTSPAYVSEMERAVKKPSLGKLADIGEILGVTVNDFIYPDTMMEHHMNKKTNFLSRIAKFSPDQQSTLLDNLNEIVEIVSTK